jgi:hypothetical protein
MMPRFQTAAIPIAEFGFIFPPDRVQTVCSAKKNCGAPEPNADAPHHPERVHLISFETPPTSRWIAF